MDIIHLKDDDDNGDVNQCQLKSNLSHLDLGRALSGEAGKELDQSVGELQVLVVQRSEKTLE